MSILASMGPVGLGIDLASRLVRAMRPGPRAEFGDVLERSLGSRLVERWDTDGDGMLSAAEFGGPLNAFQGLDRDRNGLLTPGELDFGLAQAQRLHHARTTSESLLVSHDVNHDGELDSMEFGGRDEVFKRFDADGDGFVSRDEAYRAYLGDSGTQGGSAA